MTALVHENLTTLPAHAQGLRMLVTHWAQTLDSLVSARAARQVPEWRMCEVRDEMARYRGLTDADAGRAS